MMGAILPLAIMIPFAAGVMVLFAPARRRFVKEAVAITATIACFVLSLVLFKKNILYTLPWAGFGIEFSLRLYNFSAFILSATSAFGMLIALYCSRFLEGKSYARQFYAYFLVSLSFVNGAVLSDNLVVLLFFWEGLLLTLYGMIAIGSKGAYRTAIKAFVIVGITDLCMMAGIALTAKLSATLTISKISLVPTGLAGLAFILLMIGTIAKSGSMPFHSWIPDAALDAPLPFMAFFPASLEKLVGIYFLTRLSMDMFKLSPHSGLSTLLMTIGAISIILAVMMALIQKDFKRLLSYHAISQVGYMILGIGTALPVGIAGGLFHMLNNAMYKQCLFLAGGAVERQAGTTDLEKLGGLARKMPVTFGCFLIATLSISGVPPFNGFFSKELVYDAALERGLIFYLAAAIGSFFTAASFLKLGHSAFLGPGREDKKDVKEAGLAMLIPMAVIAGLCIVFGVWNSLPLKNLIQPVLGVSSEGCSFSGWPQNNVLVTITVAVLITALLIHIFQSKARGSGLKAADYIHHAPVLAQIYGWAERGFLDPYNIGMGFARVFSLSLYALDRTVDWLYDGLSAHTGLYLSRVIRSLHNGNYIVYLSWSLLGLFLVIMFSMTGG